MSDHLISLFERQLHPRILVVGDVMLDRYVWGDVERISPEAPIPVLRVDKREHRIGGAGNVASMLAALDARPVLASVVGDDTEGGIVRNLLRQAGVDCGCLWTVSDRPTTVKERLLGRSQQHNPHHMMRVDSENNRAIPAECAERLMAEIRGSIERFDLIVVSDYFKGVCAGHMIPELIGLARSSGVRVLVDPVRGRDYRCYAGAACVTPNRLEAGAALGMEIATPSDGLQAAREMLHFGVAAALVTLDRDGIAWADEAGNARLFPCRPREVADIAGAGDMVVSAVAYCLAAGADYASAVEMANLAGGLEVERLGVAPVSRAELLAEFSGGTCAARQKMLAQDKLQEELGRLRRAGRRIAMTNGCFDLLHPGHVALLEAARQQADCLLVGLNSDRSVRQLKGEGRPLINQRDRARMLAALECVDYVVIFEETSVVGLVERVLPDVLVKSAEYTVEEVVGHEVVERHGGRVALAPVEPGYSTTRLLEKLGSAARGREGSMS
jgi:D-beta-D-heptose 7-phosphate kinase/D-beta-D-heptose 1-phosphate adenosyltransferase